MCKEEEEEEEVTDSCTKRAPCQFAPRAKRAPCQFAIRAHHDYALLFLLFCAHRVLQGSTAL